MVGFLTGAEMALEMLQAGKRSAAVLAHQRLAGRCHSFLLDASGRRAAGFHPLLRRVFHFVYDVVCRRLLPLAFSVLIRRLRMADGRAENRPVRVRGRPRSRGRPSPRHGTCLVSIPRLAGISLLLSSMKCDDAGWPSDIYQHGSSEIYPNNF